MNKFTEIKAAFIGGFAIIGGEISNLLGGWDMALKTLIIFMAVDFVSAWFVSAVFKKSPKTSTGALSSKVGWIGLSKKGMTLLVVLVAAQLDRFSGSEFIRDAAVTGYVANEGLSIVENMGLMGIPIFKPIANAIDALKKSNE